MTVHWSEGPTDTIELRGPMGDRPVFRGSDSPGAL